MRTAGHPDGGLRKSELRPCWRKICCPLSIDLRFPFAIASRPAQQPARNVSPRRDPHGARTTPSQVVLGPWDNKTEDSVTRRVLRCRRVDAGGPPASRFTARLKVVRRPVGGGS